MSSRMMETPDIIVAVDLGTTSTGVAWSTPKSRTDTINIINDWPGSSDRDGSKVPTVLIYNADRSVSSWGFLCADDEENSLGDKTRCENLKIFLDDERADIPKFPFEPTKILADYLHRVYCHVKETIETGTGRRYAGGWGNMAVDFVFSVPAIWQSHAIINRYKAILRNAGFGVEGPRHTATISLTDGEAAAVATLKNGAIQFSLGSVFLIVDMGGGMTDVSLMQVVSTDDAISQVYQVSEARGTSIGASIIDRGFTKLVRDRLDDYPDIVERLLPKDFLARLVRSQEFRMVKHKFGEGLSMQNLHRISLEGVSADFSRPGPGIEHGQMIFSVQEIQGLFDPQVTTILSEITRQLDWLRVNHTDIRVQNIILSGGLGSSAYVREQVQENLKAIPQPNATEVNIISSPDPQLVVSGILLDRQQMCEMHIPVLSGRIARASYGVVVQELYNPQLHFNEEVRKDAFNSGQIWAVNQIQWLIKKGDVIDTRVPFVKSFEIRMGPGDTTLAWDSEFVISDRELQYLPRSLKQGSLFKLCDVRCNLHGVQQHQLVLRVKRGSCFSRGYKFYVCQFDVKIMVGAVDLQFELWIAGKKFLGNDEPISVVWDSKGTTMKWTTD